MAVTPTTKPPVKTPVMNPPPTAAPVKTDADTLKVRSLDATEEKEEKAYGKVVYIVFGILLLLGVATGFFLASQRAGTAVSVAGGNAEDAGSGTAIGSTDHKTFKDSATGTVEVGGLEGEGTHQLVREGGPSQTVYLISSVVDMDQFAGKEVTVWGQTMDAKKAAWLMDVGKIEIK
jgi:hypothetical protein